MSFYSQLQALQGRSDYVHQDYFSWHAGRNYIASSRPILYRSCISENCIVYYCNCILHHRSEYFSLSHICLFIDARLSNIILSRHTNIWTRHMMRIFQTRFSRLSSMRRGASRFWFASSNRLAFRRFTNWLISSENVKTWKAKIPRATRQIEHARHKDKSKVDIHSPILFHDRFK